MIGQTTLTLEPLTTAEATEVVGTLLAGADPSTVAKVVATAEGNPLFLEELVAALGDEAADGDLPATVRAAIAARIDALPPDARTALLHASVIGQSFWRGVLEGIGDLGDVDASLEALEARGLVRRHPQSQVEGDVEFAFKHVLIRDVAYATLPRGLRRELHAATAHVIEASVPDPTELAWILAHHWREGGEPARRDRVPRWRRAIALARRIAVEETYDFYSRALDLAETDADRRRIRLRRGIALAELEEFARADEELAELIPELDGRDEIEALLARARSTFWTEQAEETLALAQRAAELAAASGDEGAGGARARRCGAPGVRDAGRGRRSRPRDRGAGSRARDVGARDPAAGARRAVPHARRQLLLDRRLPPRPRALATRGDARAALDPLERRVRPARRRDGGPHPRGDGPLRGGADDGGRRDRHCAADGPRRQRRDELLHDDAARHLLARRGVRTELARRRPARAVGLRHAVDERPRRRHLRRSPPRSVSTPSNAHGLPPGTTRSRARGGSAG